ncbi:MAG: hypothetical protein GY775_04370 [Candidatus Scalindua sp.]|nr:hypothetical protein [Candidatus Scalindua sp.]
MFDQSLHSLIGPVSRQEPPAADRSRTTNNSINEDHDRDSFHSRLMNSMEETERSSRRTSADNTSGSNSEEYNQKSERPETTDVPSESNPEEYSQKSDGPETSDVPSESNPEEYSQKSDGPETTDVPSESNPEEHTQNTEEPRARDAQSESNSEMHTQNTDEQDTNDVSTESDKAKETDYNNHIIDLLSLGNKTDQPANTDSNQTQLNPAVNKTINESEFTNAIINKISNQKISAVQKGISTLSENPLLNNQDLKTPGEQNPVIAQKQTGSVIPETAASIANTTQVTTNITQQVPGGLEQEQELQQPSLPDKTNTAQTNTKMGEQKVLDILSNLGLSGTATESGEEGTIPQLSKISARQATVLPETNINKNQIKADTNGIQNPVPAVEKAGLNPMSDAQKITNNKIIDLNTLTNAPTHTDESSNSKISEMLKGQHQNKTSALNADKNMQTQQTLTQAQVENEETPKIFETSTKTVDSKATKLFDNTTITSSSNVNTGEAAMQSNTSSNNSTFNNQGTNTDLAFNSNAVNNNQKTKLETNFNNTLSQINNSAKPLGALGNDVADNIIQSAKLYTQGGKSEVKVQLSPPELGTIKLQFKVENDVLEAKITVERPAIKDVIEKDIPRLRELISSADIDLGKLDVSLQNKENNKMDFMNKEFLSNSKGNSTQNSSQQDSEYSENNSDEASMSNNTESTQINYLV